MLAAISVSVAAYLSIDNSSGLTFDVSPASGFFSSWKQYSMAQWGEELLICPREETLFKWALNTGVDAAAISNAPDEIFYIVVTPERQVLALGCNEESSGTFNPRCIRGCDLEDLTDWTSASDNNAFEHILDSQSRIVAGGMVGSAVAVWTQDGLHAGTFLGDPGQAYRFDQVGNACGLIGPDAFVIVGQTAYWVGSDYHFWFWTPGLTPQRLPCTLQGDFRQNINIYRQQKIVAGSNSIFNEIIFFYADDRDSTDSEAENGRYVAVCLDDMSWYRGEIGRSAWHDAPTHRRIGLTGLYAGDAAGNVYDHETGTSANGSALEWHIESGDFRLGKGDNEFQIQRMIPDLEGQIGDVSMIISVRNRQQDAATAKPTITLTTSTKKKDFRATGRLARVKFASSGATSTYMRLGVPQFEVKRLGKGR